MNDSSEYFYNIRTGQVEHGRQSKGDDLMGPYASQEEASRALEIAREKTEKWDEEDRQWSGDEDEESR